MRLNCQYFLRESARPMTEYWVRLTASSTPSSAILGPPAPKSRGGNGIAWISGDCFNALTSSAASKSPLASPAMSIKDRRLISPARVRKSVRSSWTWRLMNLPRDLKRQIQRPLGRFPAHQRGPVSAHRLDKIPQLQLERLLFLNRHRLSHDAFAPELAHDGGVLRFQQFLEQRRFLLAFTGDAVNKPFLRPVIERDVARHRAGAEHADFAYLIRADAAGREIRDAAIGKAQPGVGDVLGFTEHRDADGLHAGHR